MPGGGPWIFLSTQTATQRAPPWEEFEAKSGGVPLECELWCTRGGMGVCRAGGRVVEKSVRDMEVAARASA